MLLKKEGGVTGEILGAVCEEDLTAQDVAGILNPVLSVEEQWNACEGSITTALVPSVP